MPEGPGRETVPGGGGPYTVADAPAVVARIERDLDCVRQRVVAADPGLRSLLLTGAFARGEGAMRNGRPQNDYDLVAVRGFRRPRVPYRQLRRDLERDLGVHVDLAPVASWRLRRLPGTIFWYETALRGRVLWGEDLLPRIRIRHPSRLERREGLRLIANRAAGLLLAAARGAPDALRLQAAKALLAAGDAHLLALGAFPPTQTERRARVRALVAAGHAPEPLAAIDTWLEWAYRTKTAPADEPPRDALDVWRVGAGALLDALPVALEHARLPTLEAYARTDGLLDHLAWLRRSREVPGARRLLLHPTGRVRLATLRLLAGTADGRIGPEAARRWLGGLAAVGGDPAATLDALRRATLQ